jgi:hypothetical protein
MYNVWLRNTKFRTVSGEASHGSKGGRSIHGNRVGQQRSSPNGRTEAIWGDWKCRGVWGTVVWGVFAARDRTRETHRCDRRWGGVDPNSAAENVSRQSIHTGLVSPSTCSSGGVDREAVSVFLLVGVGKSTRRSAALRQRVATVRSRTHPRVRGLLRLYRAKHRRYVLQPPWSCWQWRC